MWLSSERRPRLQWPRRVRPNLKRVRVRRSYSAQTTASNDPRPWIYKGAITCRIALSVLARSPARATQRRSRNASPTSASPGINILEAASVASKRDGGRTRACSTVLPSLKVCVSLHESLNSLPLGIRNSLALVSGAISCDAWHRRRRTHNVEHKGGETYVCNVSLGGGLKRPHAHPQLRGQSVAVWRTPMHAHVRTCTNARSLHLPARPRL